MTVFILVDFFKNKKVAIALAALGLISSPALYAAVTPSNPFHAMWNCKPVSGKWVCQTETTTDLDLYNKKLSDTKRRKAVSHALGWIPDTSGLQSTCTTCGGHYYFPGFPVPKDANASISQVPSNIHSDGGSYQVNGETILKGHVFVAQPGRRLHADSARIYQSKTQKVQKIEAHGHLKIRQPQILVLANKLNADLFSHKAKAQDVHYLIKLTPGFAGTIPGDQNFTGYAHGYAKSVNQKSKNIFDFYHATYATCPPDSKTWVLHGNHIELNNTKGRGYAYNTWLTVHDIPVFYTPYFSFPISNKRQSGFLYGSIGQNSGGGIYVSAPYYFNLAPNYDDTFTPTWYQQRGIFTSNEFRYLTKNTTGQLTTQYINDRKDKKNRGSINYAQNTQISKDWVLNANYNYVSDKNFQSDFGTGGNQQGASLSGLATQANTTVLPSEISLDFNNQNWNWTNTLERFQIVDRSFSYGNRPYNLLPQLTANATYPDLLTPFDFTALTQYTYFQKNPTESETAINGQRLLIDPKISLPMTSSYGFITPALTMNISDYNIENNHSTAALSTQFPNNQISNTIPQFDIDTGVYFVRNFKFLGSGYSQTLEPHFMYLYTPYEDQNNIPDFDTSPISFNYDQLFSLNRFSGYDRIGDTDQFTYALNSTIDNANGTQVISAGIGQIYYAKKRNVTLCYPSTSCVITEDPNYNKDTSPIAGFINYNYNQNWHVQFSEAYNTHTKSLQYQTYNLQYLADPKHIFNVGYSLNRQDYSLLTREQIVDGTAPPESSQLNTSSIWKFTPVWHVIGAWDYSVNKKKTISEFGALEYNQCCWALRLGIYRYLLTNDPNNPSDLSGNLKNTYMLQLVLKGLGGIGPSSLSTLAKQIPGYSKKSGF